MRFSFVAAATCLLTALSVSADRDNAAVTELKIETTFTPDDCSLKAQKGDKLKVHYTGKLWSNDKKFDSSLDRNSPLPLSLGMGQVITGWDEGLTGMCQGEKRTLTIPSTKAYGSRGFGSVIPPNSALVFDVELVELKTDRTPGDEL